jgi:LysM repeat protein
VYTRDASGNVLSVYSKAAAGTLQQTENHLYGSSRLGMITQHTAPDTSVLLATGFGYARKSLFIRGAKLFELSNHLGNVLVMVTDRRQQSSGAGVNVDYYQADVAGANDYYPGGMQMPGRLHTTGNSYRYSINGQEKTPEIAPNTTTAEFWQYDARIARRWNVDPIPKKYESSYMAFGGNPISVIDPNGADSVKVNGKWTGVWRSEKGNSLKSLAKTFGTSTETIERLNPDVNFKKLEVGTNIIVQGETSIFGASDGALAVQQKGALEVTPLLNYKMNFLYNQLQQDGYINFMMESLGISANISIANNTVSAISIGVEGNLNLDMVYDNVNKLLNAFGLKVDVDISFRIQPGIMRDAKQNFDLTKTVVNSNYRKGYGWFGRIKPTVISEMQKAIEGASPQIQTYTNIMIESIMMMFAKGNMHDWSGDDPDQVTLKGERFFSPGTIIYHKYLGITIDKQ